MPIGVSDLSLEPQQIIFLIILAVTLVLLISEKLRVDLVTIMATLALALTGILDPREALSGFSSEPAIIVAAVFVLSAGLAATGITDRIGLAIGKAVGGSEWRTIAVVMPATAALAAFSHHLMVTAMMLPILMRLARKQKMAASRLLMPMSLAASLGTTLTLISAPAFLLANDLLKRSGEAGVSIFSITPIGLALVLIGTIYMLLTRWLVPKRSGKGSNKDYASMERYYTELVVDKDSPWIGKSYEAFREAFQERMQVIERLRYGMRRQRPHPESELQHGDVLVVCASTEEIASIKNEPGLSLHALVKYGVQTGTTADQKSELHSEEQLTQAIVTSHAEFVGRSVGSIDFLNSFGVIVVGLWRKEGWLHGELSQVVLEEGDLLMLWGRQHDFNLLSQQHSALLMPHVEKELKRRRATRAIVIMLGSIIATAVGWLTPQISFLTGAVLMVLTRCVDIKRAYEEIDVRIFVMIAGVIPLGIAMEKTGTAAWLASLLSEHAQNWTALTLLLVMFSAAALLTQILSDSATTVLLTPIALAMAHSLGEPPTPFVICIAMGAVASFLTPIGHHGNLLILTPGQYTFGDFLRVGLPLTVLIAITSAWMSRWLWMNGPLLPFGWGL